LACYIEGKKKQGHDSCMVRGFWGDIVNSPYLSYGLELETRDEITYFYANNKIDYLRDSQDVTEYNLVKFLLRMDHDEKYDFMKREKEKERLRKERIKKEEEEQEKKEKEEEEKKKKEEEKNKKKLKSIKEEEEDEEEEEICTTVGKKVEKTEKNDKNDKKDEGVIIGKDEGVKEMTEKLAKVVSENKSSDTTEESIAKAIEDGKEYDTNELIQAFREIKFKIFLVSDDIEKSIYKKKKFKNFFDIVLYGFHAKSKFNDMQKSVLKPSSRILFELNSYMASFEEKTRKEYKENLVKMCKNNGFVLDDTSLKYLYQFKIKQENQGQDENENENNSETINTTEESNTIISTNTTNA